MQGILELFPSEMYVVLRKREKLYCYFDKKKPDQKSGFEYLPEYKNEAYLSNYFF